MDRPYRRLLFPDLAHNTEIPPLLLQSPGSAALDDDIYRLVAIICQRVIVPWYSKFSGDRQLYAHVVHVVRTLVRQGQVRLGSARTLASGTDSAIGTRAARTRVLFMLGERLPRILMQHVRSFREAHRMASTDARMGVEPKDFASYYLATCPAPPIAAICGHYVSESYLTASAETLLSQLCHRYGGITGLRLAHMENLLLRDITVHIVRTILEGVTPWGLVAACHAALDRQSARASEMHSFTHALWVSITAVNLIMWTLLSQLLDALVWHDGLPKRNDDTDAPLVVPAITSHYVAVAAEMLEMRSRPLSMACYALVEALVTVIGGVVDRALSRLILEQLYNDTHVGSATRTLCAALSGDRTPLKQVPSADEQAASFDRLCDRCLLLVPEILRPLLGPNHELQRRTIKSSLAPVLSPDASVGLLRCEILAYESMLLVLCPDLDTPAIPMRP